MITGLETLVLLTLDPENKLQPPRLPQECHHGLPPKECTESNPDRSYRCPSGDEIKYRMTRVTIDAVDFYLVESSTAINLLVSETNNIVTKAKQCSGKVTFFKSIRGSITELKFYPIEKGIQRC